MNLEDAKQDEVRDDFEMKLITKSYLFVLDNICTRVTNNKQNVHFCSRSHGYTSVKVAVVVSER